MKEIHGLGEITEYEDGLVKDMIGDVSAPASSAPTRGTPCRSGASLMPSGAPRKPAALRAAALRGRDARARLTQFCCSCACCAAHGPGGQGRRLHRLSAQLSCDHMPPDSHVATAIANGESLSIKCDFLNWAARVVKDGPPWSPIFCWNQRRVVKM